MFNLVPWRIDKSMVCIFQEVDRLQQRLAEMQTRETANGNLQNKAKVGSIFRSTSKSKAIKVSQNKLRPLSLWGPEVFPNLVLSGMAKVLSVVTS